MAFCCHDSEIYTAGNNASNRMSISTPPAGPTSFGDRTQGRAPQPGDARPTSPGLLPSTSTPPGGTVAELRQLVAGLQSQNSQLIQLTKQQQSKIAHLEVGKLL